MKNKETNTDIDFVYDKDIDYIEFSGRRSPLAENSYQFARPDQIGVNLNDQDPLKFNFQIAAAIPGKPELKVPWHKKLWFDAPPLVWTPEIQMALKRHLHGDNSVKPDTHDIHNFVVLPEGALVGGTLIATGAIDRLVRTNTRWSESGLRPSLSALKHQVDSYGRITESEVICRSRSGIMAEVNIDTVPIALHQTYGKFGRTDTKFSEVYQPFIGLRSAAREAAYIDIASHDISPRGSSYPDRYGIKVGPEPIVIEINLFEGTEDLLEKQTKYYKGFTPEHLHHQPNSETSRCPACGKVGMDTDAYHFGKEVTPLGYREIRPGSAQRISQLTLAIVTPEVSSSVLSGNVAESCCCCYPASCHELHWSYIDYSTPYKCHDFINNEFCDEHLPDFQTLSLQTFPREIREKIIRKELGEDGVVQDRFFHRF